MTRYIVTAAPPNPNGDLHLGHLSGPFLGADVQARYLQGQGHSVLHVSYIDEHSCYVPRRARELGADPYETARALGTRIEQTLALGHMLPGFVGRPHRGAHHDLLVTRHFSQLWDRGCLQVAEDDVYWCSTCEHYLYEAEMRGSCHHCGAASDGFYCEECGRPQTSGQLREAYCTTCGSIPTLRRHRRIFFPLDKYRHTLTDYFRDRPLRPRLRQYLDLMLSEPLPATPISRIGEYGIGVPLEEWAGHYLDTWFSGYFGYLAAAELAARTSGHETPDWADDEAQVLEFFGFDCSFSHAVLWTALAMALGTVPTPAQLNTNEFYRLEGAKFSTSRGHAIWGGEFLTTVPADSLRFHLCLTGPETKQTNFSRRAFADTTRDVLVGGLQCLLARFDDATLAPTPGATDAELLERVDSWRSEVGASLEPAHFSPAAAAESIRCHVTDASLAALVDSAGGSARLTALRQIAGLAHPLMPGWTNDVLTAIDPAYPQLAAFSTSPGRTPYRLTVGATPIEIRSLALDE
ncbi:class I tRNA ligase family protein [Jatrophihabitans lederbergiae]|uniref:Class I tRNA ligase family protein n=1 Tax=Jatrophihabitans lederbergiae TaxID=3075547 RepID=A0ABU2J9Y6_9ACTN|nr:class I tRNA ligase family protein [Jatrophihabitans sp. DSM 44399]MDT0261444.1 class I tRNA ligase family protein [Jatrophihabitans sp. DSM 44399]